MSFLKLCYFTLLHEDAVPIISSEILNHTGRYCLGNPKYPEAEKAYNI